MKKTFHQLRDFFGRHGWIVLATVAVFSKDYPFAALCAVWAVYEKLTDVLTAMRSVDVELTVSGEEFVFKKVDPS